MLILLVCTLVACEEDTMHNPVPKYPVGFRINTKMGMYVLLDPANNINTGTWLIGDPISGYFTLHTPQEEHKLPLTPSDVCGYGGVLVYVDNNAQYCAFNLCCPNCYLPTNNPPIRVAVEGIFAVCPECGEHYDLSFGYAIPTKGIAKYPLLRYSTIYANDVLTVRN